MSDDPKAPPKGSMICDLGAGSPVLEISRYLTPGAPPQGANPRTPGIPRAHASPAQQAQPPPQPQQHSPQQSQPYITQMMYGSDSMMQQAVQMDQQGNYWVFYPQTQNYLPMEQMQPMMSQQGMYCPAQYQQQLFVQLPQQQHFVQQQEQYAMQQQQQQQTGFYMKQDMP